MANMAADALRRAKHQLREVDRQDEMFNLLGGLAIVAGVTRSSTLAVEVRNLVRVLSRRGDFKVPLEDVFRVVMVAASAHSEFDSWCRYLGEWLTELSFQDMDKVKSEMLGSRIRGLCGIEPRLWSTCSRAEAACWARAAA